MRSTAKRSTAMKGAVVAGVSVLVVGLAMWPSGAGADSGKDGNGKVLTGAFATDRDEFAFLDNDESGRASIGDEFVYTNSSSGVFGDGTDYGHCAFHQVDPAGTAATLHCTATNENDRGSLTFQGTLRVGFAPDRLEPGTWAITGGTGDFEKARGSVEIDRSEGTGLDYKSFGTLRVVLRP